MSKYNIEGLYKSLSKEEITKGNKIDSEAAEVAYKKFVDFYKEGSCSICKKSLKTFSSESTCLHYLLRLSSNFKPKKHFKDIYNKWGYFNIASYLRWIANQERFLGNINNLEDEKDISKIFEYTIKWKNIEWTFSCCEGDFSGHERINSNFPHYHFQMRIDNKSLIDFSDFHVPFSDEDLFNFEAIESGYMLPSWGNGSGIQEALNLMESLPNNGIDSMKVSANENNAQFRVQTVINGPIKGDDLAEIAIESQKTGRTLASLAREKFGENKVFTNVSPIETIPDIRKRQGGRGKGI